MIYSTAQEECKQREDNFMGASFTEFTRHQRQVIDSGSTNRMQLPVDQRETSQEDHLGRRLTKMEAGVVRNFTLDMSEEDWTSPEGFRPSDIDS